MKINPNTQKAPVTKNTKLAKAVKAVKAAARSAGTAIKSLFYQQLRGTALFVGNLRQQDFTKQEFEAGALKTAVQAIITVGKQGTAASQARVKLPFVDLGNGQLFDITGVKQQNVVSLGAALIAFARKHGKAHTIRIKAGPMKGEHAGFIIGSMDLMNVAFVSSNGQKVWTLNNRSLGQRNADRTYELVK